MACCGLEGSINGAVSEHGCEFAIPNTVCTHLNMPPEFSISQIGKAGRRLRKEETSPEQRESSLEVLAYWRTQHSEPLKIAFSELKASSLQHDSRTLLALREKRAKSIIDKLKRERTMNLTKMQDIAGCRAIVGIQKDALKIARSLKKKKHIKQVNNYINTPKSDGYRGIHLVGNYRTRSFENLQVEFQIRTNIQHAWATAGEITELFSATPIKNLYGDANWKHFYRLAADCFSVIDSKYMNRDINPVNFDVDQAVYLLRTRHGAELGSISREIKKRARELRVYEKFEIFRNTLQFSKSHVPEGSEYCVIHALNLGTNTPSIEVHMCGDIVSAQAINLSIERKIVSDTEELVVMLSVGAMASLEAAYPNYFADSGFFMTLLKTIEKI